MDEALAIMLVVCVSVIGAFGSLFQKKGSAKLRGSIRQPLRFLKSYFTPEVIFSFVLYGLATLLFTFALQFHKVAVLYPLTSLTYVWIAFLSMLMLGERLNTYKWAGITSIVIGVVLLTL